MNAAELQARVVASEEFVILGRRLLPLTLGHVAVLHNLGCQNPTNPGALGVAILACSMPHDRVLPYFRSWLFPIRLWWWRVWLGVWSFPEKLAMFREYLAFHTELPEVIFKGGAESGPIPAHQCYRTLLLSRLGYSPEKVDFAPYLQAKWDFITLLDLEGKADVLDCTASDIDEQIEEMDIEDIQRRAMALFNGVQPEEN